MVAAAIPATVIAIADFLKPFIVGFLGKETAQICKSGN